MSESKQHVEVKRPPERSFGFLFTMIFTGLTLWLFLQSGVFYVVLALVSVILLFISIFTPHVLRPINILWFKFGLVLSAIVSPVVMSLVYFVVVTPTGLIMRLLGKDPLGLDLDAKAKSYWIKRDTSRPLQSMKDQF